MTYNFTKGFEQLLILYFSFYICLFVQMINKTEHLYYEILIFIFKYITENFDETKLELKTFCTDFEVALI